MYFLATALNATVGGVIFNAHGDNGFARATRKMNSKSKQDFRWSLRLYAANAIGIGIASTLPSKNDNIRTFDKNAIIYYPYIGTVMKEMKRLESNIIVANAGDEIHLRFQPQLKKFIITFVCSSIFT